MTPALKGLATRRAPPSISLAERVASLPCPSPREIDEHLEQLGYRGQRDARRSISVLAWRHIRRLQRLHLKGASPSDLPDRDAYLLIGPTGCGKTHLIELIFSQVLQVPTVVVDITQFSETGYVGHDASSILTRLVDAAGGDPAWAACGIVCLDEFDKIAGSVSSTRFAGAETTKDVSGWGVQRSLLTLLSAPTAEYAPDHGFAGRTRPEALPLSGVTFIACGAFSRLRGRRVHRRGLGFRAPDLLPSRLAGATEPAVLEWYGFMPELLGRFTRLVELQPLGREELESILTNVLERHRSELAAEGLELPLQEEMVEGIIEGALRRGYGARGLHLAVTRLVEDVIYDQVKGANG